MKNNTVYERIKKIGEELFLLEPLFFLIYCTHRFICNNALHFPMRTGNLIIEYSEKLLENEDDSTLKKYITIELIRILLKHPYQRQPLFSNRNVLILASNITINDSYRIPNSLNCPGPGLFTLPEGLCFEEYYSKVFAILNNPPLPPKENLQFGYEKSKSNNCNDVNEILNQEINELTELWTENEDACMEINKQIEITEASQSWGTIGEKLQGIIKASIKVNMDYRRMLNTFRTSVISMKRKLSRNKPNRRYGFNAMGSRYEFTTNILIAVDVSGSVTDESLQYFFSVINQFFKYGIEKLDVIQFDSEIKNEKPLSLKKAKSTVQICGRGGTSFQCVADFYLEHSEYDGLIIFTDGYAPSPVFKTLRRIDVLWVLINKAAYEKHKDWIKKIRRNKATYIPMP